MRTKGSEYPSAAEVIRARWKLTRDQARGAAERVARMLVEEFGARRVWLFGSLATGRGFRKSSDIDLAVEGLPPEELFRAVGRALQASDFAVDIKRVEDLQLKWQERIRSEGEVLA